MTVPPVPIKKKMPRWVWALTIASTLFLVAMFGLMFWGWFWVQEQLSKDIARRYPEFEFVALTSDSKAKLRHKRTGKELDFVEPRDIAVSRHATADGGPAPEWTKLPEAVAGAEGLWQVAGVESYEVLAQLTEQLDGHEYLLERRRPVKGPELVACDHKTLTCLAFAIRGAKGGTEYRVVHTRVP